MTRRTPPSLRPVTLAGLEIADRSGDLTDAIEIAMAQAEWLTQQGPRHARYVRPLRRFRWAWTVVDEATTPATVLAEGTAWTRERAWKRVEKAYARELRAAEDRDYHNDNCRNALPKALLLMPYALIRYAIDKVREARR